MFPSFPACASYSASYVFSPYSKEFNRGFLPTKLFSQLSRCGNMFLSGTFSIYTNSQGLGTISGFYRCKSRFCPYCASSATKVRRRLLFGGIDLAGLDLERYTHVFLTLTFKKVQNAELREAAKKFSTFWRIVRSHRYFRSKLLGFVRGNEVTVSGSAFEATLSSSNFHYHSHILATWSSFTKNDRVRLYKVLKQVSVRVGLYIDYSRMKNRWCKIIEPSELVSKFRYVTKVVSYSTKLATGEKGGLVDVHPLFKSLLAPILKGLRLYGTGGIYTDAIKSQRHKDLLAVKSEPVIIYNSDVYLLHPQIHRHFPLQSCASWLSSLPPLDLNLLQDFIPCSVWKDSSSYVLTAEQLSSSAIREYLFDTSSPPTLP